MRAPAPLVAPGAAAAGALACAVAVGGIAVNLALWGTAGLFNDFYDYWGAARLLAAGHSPYDVAALQALLHAAGVQSTVGGGYSYPALFAVVVAPLAALPPATAGLAFSALGLLGLWLAVALLVSSIPGAGRKQLLLAGAIAGLTTPVRGSLYFGQANLLVLPLLAVAYRGLSRPLALAVATAVKLYPVAGFAALAARGRDAVPGLLKGLGVTALLVVVPNLLLEGFAGGRTASELFAPDPYRTNQSLNGWLSRLALNSEVSRPPLPGFSVDVVEPAAVGVLVVAVVALVWARHGRPWQGCLALLLVLGVVAAPKNSLWNYTPLLLAAAYCWSSARHRPGPLLVLLAAWTLVEAQPVVDFWLERAGPASPSLTPFMSTALFGALLLGGLTAYLVLQPAVVHLEDEVAVAGHPDVVGDDDH